ncbi:hypothetical protein XENOCAPTIV_014843 [Xenoophorus captivus]|uniref:Uncharacterized protein n=1 Tax=Xenoophorus captivus TaxID=1517983 RepID=A0ABV0RAD6_9TELE
MSHLQMLIKFCFMLGLSHGKILLLFSNLDSIEIIMRTLRRNIKHVFLNRRKNKSVLTEVAAVDQLEGQGEARWIQTTPPEQHSEGLCCHAEHSETFIDISGPI